MIRKHKIVLEILKTFGGTLSRKMLQKLVFLFCECNDAKLYDFVPYKYGCYSFALASDQERLTTQGFLKNREEWTLSKGISFPKLDEEDRDGIDRLFARFGKLSETELLRYVYTAYPFYAINSEIAHEILDKNELKVIAKIRNNVNNVALYSIGYEGLSLESYLSKILAYDVKVVCDVRKNPISRKFGFSKGVFSSELNKVGVEYIHFPQLGIPSEYRQSLETQADYDKLFKLYEKTILSKNLNFVEEISSIIDAKKRVALLCYERDPKQCHRTRVANKILEYRERDIKVITQ